MTEFSDYDSSESGESGDDNIDMSVDDENDKTTEDVTQPSNYHSDLVQLFVDMIETGYIKLPVVPKFVVRGPRGGLFYMSSVNNTVISLKKYQVEQCRLGTLKGNRSVPNYRECDGPNNTTSQ